MTDEENGSEVEEADKKNDNDDATEDQENELDHEVVDHVEPRAADTESIEKKPYTPSNSPAASRFGSIPSSGTQPPSYYSRPYLPLSSNLLSSTNRLHMRPMPTIPSSGASQPDNADKDILV